MSHFVGVDFHHCHLQLRAIIPPPALVRAVETRVFLYSSTRLSCNKVIRRCKTIFHSGYFHSLLCSSSLHTFIFLFLSLRRPPLPFVFLYSDNIQHSISPPAALLFSFTLCPRSRRFLARCSCIQISTINTKIFFLSPYPTFFFLVTCLWSKRKSRAEFMRCSADNILFLPFLCSVCGRHTGFLFPEVCVHLSSCLSSLISHSYKLLCCP